MIFAFHLVLNGAKDLHLVVTVVKEELVTPVVLSTELKLPFKSFG